MPDAGGIQIRRRWTRIDQQTTIIVGGIVLFVLLYAFAIVWRLRHQVGTKDKDLAQVVARLNTTYDAVREALLVIGPTGATIACNSKASDVLGVSRDLLTESGQKTEKPSIQQTISDRLQDATEFNNTWERTIAVPQTSTSLEITTKDHPPRTLVAYTAPVVSTDGTVEARIWTFDDISHRKSLEATLLHSQKMEAVGRMAGGVGNSFVRR